MASDVTAHVFVDLAFDVAAWSGLPAGNARCPAGMSSRRSRTRRLDSRRCRLKGCSTFPTSYFLGPIPTPAIASSASPASRQRQLLLPIRTATQPTARACIGIHFARRTFGSRSGHPQDQNESFRGAPASSTPAGRASEFTAFGTALTQRNSRRFCGFWVSAYFLFDHERISTHMCTTHTSCSQFDTSSCRCGRVSRYRSCS